MPRQEFIALTGQVRRRPVVDKAQQRAKTAREFLEVGNFFQCVFGRAENTPAVFIQASRRPIAILKRLAFWCAEDADNILVLPALKPVGHLAVGLFL